MFDLENISTPEELVKVDHNLDDHDSEVKLKMNTASNIINDFLHNLLSETLSSDVPKEIYEYEIHPPLVPKDIYGIIDAALYSLFHKNFYAYPEVYYGTKKENNETKIIINASLAIKCIEITDKKIYNDINELLLKESESFEKGESVVFKDFTHLTYSLPDAYIITRSKRIIETLTEKGYKVAWDGNTRCITISIA